MSNLSVNITDDDIDGNLEVDSMPFDVKSGQPYQPLVFNDTKNPWIEKEYDDLKIKYCKVKEERSPDKLTEFKKEDESKKVTKILSDEIKTECE